MTVALVLGQGLTDFPAVRDWPYATLLATLMFVLVRGRTKSAPTAADLVRGGGLLVGLTGLAAGLLGASTETVARAPGTVAPLPDLKVAAFFPAASPESIAGTPPDIVFRRRDGTSFALAPGARRWIDGFSLAVRVRPAAYVDARDGAGGRLTVTQPNGAFLSPVLLFPQEVAVGGHEYPADAFALPARGVQVRALYFTPDRVSRASTIRALGGRPGTLLSVDDDTGHPLRHGIVLAGSGRNVAVGGVHLTLAAGSYPEIVVSSAPVFPAWVVGTATILMGALILLRRKACGMWKEEGAGIFYFF